MAERIFKRGIKRRIEKIESQIDSRSNITKSVLPEYASYSDQAALPYREHLYAFEVMEGLLKMIRGEVDFFDVNKVSGGKFKFNIEG